RVSLPARSCSARACCRSRRSLRPARSARPADPGRRSVARFAQRGARTIWTPPAAAGFLRLSLRLLREAFVPAGTAGSPLRVKVMVRLGSASALAAMALELGACNETMGVDPSSRVAEVYTDKNAQASNAGNIASLTEVIERNPR